MGYYTTLCPSPFTFDVWLLTRYLATPPSPVTALPVRKECAVNSMSMKGSAGNPT